MNSDSSGSAPSTRPQRRPQSSPAPDEIRQQMAALRAEIGEEVDDIVVNARDMSDWKYYVRRYPWICLGGAALAGYYLVPQKLRIIQPNPEDLKYLAEKNKVVIKPTPEPEPKGPGGALFTFLVSTLVRTGMAAIGQKVGKMINESQSLEKPSQPAPPQPRPMP